MMRHSLGWIVLVATACAAAVLGDVPDHDVDTIINHMDELYRAGSSYAEVEMEIITPHWQRTLEMKVWSAGTDRTFIRILAPRKEKGIGTLRIGNEMWNYLPKINKVMKVPPSMMMGSWMGSDFTNDDLVSEFTYLDDYTCGWAEVERPEPETLYIECRPNEGVPVVWGHLVMALREADYLPIWEKFYDEKGRPMRSLVYSDIRTFGERTVPSTMEMIPETKEGHRTMVRYVTAAFDIAVDDEIFSLRHLRSQ